MRMLYVEDNRINALLFEEIVQLRSGIELRVAEDGREALGIATEWPPDVLVLDAHLPDVNGVDLLATLRTLPGLAGVPAFMCSADSQPGRSAARRRRRLCGYWTKPIAIAGVLADLDALSEYSPRPYELRARAGVPARRARRARRSCCATSARPTRRRRRPCAATCGEFLSDPRVVEIPRAGRGCRSCTASSCARGRRKSAANYASIWTPEGSPLRVWTEQAGQAAAPATSASAAIAVLVRLRDALRPARRSRRTLDALKAEGATRILVLPLYPQYSATTTASVVRRRVRLGARASRTLPELRFVNRYHDDPRLHRRARPQRAASTGGAHGRARQAGAELPRRARSARCDARRPLPLRMPEDRAAARRAAAAAARPAAGHVPVPLRPRQMARALHRADPAPSWRATGSSAST